MFEINYQFKNPELLNLALTHRSYSGSRNNERLEFLGDSLLGQVISEYLYHHYPDLREGDLTRLKSHVVRGETLTKVALRLSLGEYILLGAGEMKTGGHRRASILADCVEAVIGAVFIDGGFDEVRTLILDWFQPELELVSETDIEKDAKTRLQEYMQANKLGLPVYTVISESGDDHEKLFRVSCSLKELNRKFYGDGGSRRKAEQSAASIAINELQANK